MLEQIHVEEESGGVLVFLPGQDDIESLHSLLEDNLPKCAPPPSSSSSSSQAADTSELPWTLRLLNNTELSYSH